jgi:hypothetical protein
MAKRGEEQNPSPEEFEKLVEAALKVDPKGLSGKHKNDTKAKDK